VRDITINFTSTVMFLQHLIQCSYRYEEGCCKTWFGTI